MIPVTSYTNEPSTDLEHWLAVKTRRPLKLPKEIWQLILDNFKILSLPTSEVHIPQAIDYIRTLTYDKNKQEYLDYVAKYFSRVSPTALGGFVTNQKLENDRDIVLVAVKQYSWLIEHASPELKHDREIMLAAVQKDGWSLKYAS